MAIPLLNTALAFLNQGLAQTDASSGTSATPLESGDTNTGVTLSGNVAVGDGNSQGGAAQTPATTPTVAAPVQAQALQIPSQWPYWAIGIVGVALLFKIAGRAK